MSQGEALRVEPGHRGERHCTINHCPTNIELHDIIQLKGLWYRNSPSFEIVGSILTEV